MRLYYMTSLKTAVQHILPERRMKLSTVDKVNDPFELGCVATKDREHRALMRILRDHWIKSFGFISTSSHWKSPLMWAHYADQHKGVCLGFDCPDDFVKPIIYEPDRLRDLIDWNKPEAGLTQEVIERILWTKYKQWEYEDEHRMVAGLEDQDPKTGFHYVDFDEKLILRDVIVGARCTASVGSFRKLIDPVHKDVTVIKARPAFDTFTMVRQKRVTPIVIKPRKR